MKIMLSLVLQLIFSCRLVISIKCYDNEQDSICYNREIDSKRIICKDFKSCYLSTLNASLDIKCGGLKSCNFAQNITTPSNISCNGEYGCARAEHLQGGFVSCNGDHGCAYVDSIKSTSLDIECNGYYGCNGVGLINSSRDIYCNGESSCADIDNQIIADSFIYCGGENSCFNANNIISMRRSILCAADYSCQNATNIAAAYYAVC